MAVPNTNSKMPSVKRLLNDSKSSLFNRTDHNTKVKSLDTEGFDVCLKLYVRHPLIHGTECPKLLDDQLDQVHNPVKLTILCCVLLPLVAL